MARYNFDYAKLKGKLRENGITYREYANKLGLSIATISERLNNNAQFSQSEITATIQLLNINPAKIEEYFFKQKVQ